MARKKGTGTLEEQRQDIIRAVRRGRRVRTVKSDGSLQEYERAAKQQMLCYLKASSFSNKYCADALEVAPSTIQAWMDDPSLKLRDQIAQISANMTAAGVALIQSYQIELIEGLMQIFRETDDEKLAKEIAFELLDRIGITKVNKSESVVSGQINQTRRVEITDTSGIAEIAKKAPPEVQAAMAEQASRLLALAQEHGTVENEEAADASA